MTDRLEIASRVLAWMVHEHNSPDVAARESLYFADALLAAHEATAPKAEALPDDAPVMEWRVILVETTCKGEFWRGKPQQVTYQLVAESGADYFSAASVWDREAAGADLPALRAAATAYSAAKGYRAVFTGTRLGGRSIRKLNKLAREGREER